MGERRRAQTVFATLGVSGVLLMVGAPAAVTSYRHARTVAATFDETGMSPWLPLTTDGLIVAALVVMGWRRWHQQPVGWPVWTAFVLGMVATLAANLTSSALSVRGMDWGTAIVGVWPPLAFAATLELLALFIRGQAGDRTQPDSDQLYFVYRRLNELERALTLLPGGQPDGLADGQPDGQPDDGLSGVVTAGDPEPLMSTNTLGWPDDDPWADTPDTERSDREDTGQRPVGWPAGTDAWTAPLPTAADVAADPGPDITPDTPRPVRMSTRTAGPTDDEIVAKVPALREESGPVTAYLLRKTFNIGAKRAERIMVRLTEGVDA